MTAPARAPVAAGLTREGRLQLLWDLSHRTHLVPYDAVMAELRRLAHESLDWLQVVDTFAAHQQCVARRNALAAGVAHWSEFYGEATVASYSGDADDAAKELLDKEARALMWTLATGECGG